MLGFLFLRLMSESRAREGQNVSELDSPIWSVISFDRCEASGLTYQQAVIKVTELESQNVSGLCIVTNESASLVGR